MLGARGSHASSLLPCLASPAPSACMHAFPLQLLRHSGGDTVPHSKAAPTTSHSFISPLTSACLQDASGRRLFCSVPSASYLAWLPASMTILLPKHWTTCVPPSSSLLFQLSSQSLAAVATRHCRASRRGACMPITGRAAVADDTSTSKLGQPQKEKEKAPPAGP